MPTSFVITFAGAPGSSKSTIAHHLSWNLGLPVLNNDIMRNETIADLGQFDETVYLAKRDERLKHILESGKPFIYDASVDRAWGQQSGKELLARYGYRACIISLDLSPEKLKALQNYKDNPSDEAFLDQLLQDHADFLKTYREDVTLHLTDTQFPDRLAIALKAVTAWIENTAQ